MRWRRRDLTRTCAACGHQWTVPRALRRRLRPTRWRSGIHPADLGPIGGVFPSEIRYALDQAAQRRATQDAEMTLRSQLATCPNCATPASTGRRHR